MRNCKYKPFYSGLDIKYNPKSGQIRWVSHFLKKKILFQIGYTSVACFLRQKK